MKQMRTIGSKIFVSFPRQAVFDVHAKVDTGAYSSSVWASNIKEENGVVSYNLFGEEFEQYSGKVVKTQQFKKLKIKNSFGDSEVRYKVPLLVQIGDIKVNAWFTLANRKRNTYPVLIGVRTLRGRFVVDVSRKAHALHGNVRPVKRINKIKKALSWSFNS